VIYAQTAFYENTGNGRNFAAQVSFQGHTTTGPQAMVLRTSTSAADTRPFTVLSPSGSTDGNLGQSQTTFVVFEVEPR